ncbi:hypothetical protein GPD67_003676 [Salmonella enterica]|uniref:hypothetical protein n=1 Tax=Escherichia coli TaxID=562 RepID=UPI0005A82384|nr:hypothetical protein [Escherichia coli]EAQ7811919.1 hypothetical protein [Salmonella enterica]ELK6843029.1 hypothetical protein [Citrobacter braakii]HCJ7760359.1 hypothetical protein [Citrobacter freundii]ECH2871195.1 hypothetical protein [Salmonella enterica]EDE3330823.1 hypothetical protein [Salmonella enterica]
MPNAHCICPDFVGGHISDPIIFSNVFMGTLLQSNDQILLDMEGRLEYAYTQSVEKNTGSFELLKTWRVILNEHIKKQNGKVLLTPSSVNDDHYGIVFDVIKNSVSTFQKCILAYNNSAYEPFCEELSKRRIELFNLQNVTPINIEKFMRKKFSMDDLIHDISYILHLLARTKTKGSLEDEYNDHVRNMLRCKEYEVNDQGREGESPSGLGAGELDLVINQNGSLAAIIEAMKLNSISQNYINEHYRKLVTSYNPLQVSNTILLTYYTGNRFDEWWPRYVQHINGISKIVLGLKNSDHIISTEIIDTPYAHLKQLIQFLQISGEIVKCAHLCVKF